MDINLLFEQSTNNSKPKKQTPPSAKKGHKTEVENNAIPSSSGSATAIPLASEPKIFDRPRSQNNTPGRQFSLKLTTMTITMHDGISD